MHGYFEGLFDGLPKGVRRWLVELRHTTLVWLDCVDEGPEGGDVRKQVERELDRLRTQVAADKPQHFVYFLASRSRVRIASGRPPRYSRWRRKLVVWIEAGPKRELHKVALPLPLHGLLPREAPLYCQFRWTDKFITFEVPYGDGVGRKMRKYSVSIHNLLEGYLWNIREYSSVHYVGMTKNPRARVFDNTRVGIKGGHGGYTRVRAEVHAQDRDLFAFFMVMDVHAVSSLEQFGLIVASDPRLHKVSCQDEACVLEKALIAYFHPDATGSMKHEMSRLRTLYRRHGIEEIALSLEMKSGSDYFYFRSDVVPPHARIAGYVRINGSKVEVERCPNMPDLQLQARLVGIGHRTHA